MKDEEYVYVSDVREKAITARSARKTRTHCGKGGRVRFPSDNLSKKELQKMNGEVKSYRLNSPLTWDEFKELPDDLKIAYIKALRNKYDVSNKHLTIALGWPHASLDNMLKKLGLNTGKRGNYTWDKDGFYAWVNGVGKPSTPVIEETEVEIQQNPEDITDNESFMEEDIPFYEEYCTEEKTKVFTAVPNLATPFSGTMDFECPANQALNMLAQVLGQTKCEISIRWRVIDEGGVECE